VTIIITVIGAILTSLVIAREWERGTMEALLATRISRAEFLLSKFIPYYLLGMFALLVCMAVSVPLFGVPFRGSFPALLGASTLFLANTLGLGLLISTLTRNQFNAAQVALNTAFLPAVMLSGFVFEIDSMPALVRAVTYIIPARYYVSIMHTLFLAGSVPLVLLVNSLLLAVTAVVMLGLTVLKTRLRLE
jgi:ABC-2 type transport system permease protein